MKLGAMEVSVPTTRASHAGDGGTETGQGKRFSARKKLMVVQRVMRGESLETLWRAFHHGDGSNATDLRFTRE